MEALSVRDYRNNLSASFDRADQGERVLIRRRNRVYALVSVDSWELEISPALKKRINEARKAYKEGNVVSCSTPKELEDFLEEL